MHIVVVGLSHRTAPVEVREKLSIPDQTMTESLKALKAFSREGSKMLRILLRAVLLRNQIWFGRF